MFDPCLLDVCSILAQCMAKYINVCSTLYAVLQELAQWSSIAPVEGERLPFPVGSVAVRHSRAATLRAQRSEQQLVAAVAERDALARQVEELKPPELQQPDGNVGQSSSCAYGAVLFGLPACLCRTEVQTHPVGRWQSIS